MIKIVLIFIFFSVLVSLTSQAAYFQSPVSEAKLSAVLVRTSNGQSDLMTLADPDKPVLLVPAYFSCNSTCPLMTQNLRDAFNGLKNNLNINVIILSFNKTDGMDELKMFQTHHDIPKQWSLAIVNEESDAKELLNPLGYRFEKTPSGFDHPNSAFIFSSKNKIWTGIISGLDNTTSDLQKAILEAESFENKGYTLVKYLKQPEFLIVLSFAGLLFSFSTIMFILLRKNKKLKAASY